MSGLRFENITPEKLSEIMTNGVAQELEALVKQHLHTQIDPTS